MSDKGSINASAESERHEQVSPISKETEHDTGRKMSKTEIEDAVRSGSVPTIKGGEKEALEIAKAGGWEVDALMVEMENELQRNPKKKSMFDISFNNPKNFT